MARPAITELYRRESARMSGDKAEHRALVFAYPDLIARLTKLPWPFARPEQWTGHIPPYLFGGVRNDSPQRAALVELVREAVARKHGEEIAATWLKAINHDPNAATWTAHAATLHELKDTA